MQVVCDFVGAARLNRKVAAQQFTAFHDSLGKTFGGAPATDARAHRDSVRGCLMGTYT